MRILVIGPSWVGDMVMAQVLFRLLKARDPAAEIDVLAPAWSLPLIARMPEVREGIAMPLGHGEFSLGARWRLGRQLRAKGYQWAIVLPNSLKSGFIPLFAGIPRRTGWRGEMRYGWLNDLRVLDKARYPLMIERFAALALPPGEPLPSPLPWPRLMVDAGAQSALLQQLKLSLERPVLALCPGAEFGPAKRWPEQHYSAVASAWIARGGEVWLLGSAKDTAVGVVLRHALPAEQRGHCHNLAGNTALVDAVDLLSMARVVVSNDSGLMHIACAVGTPLVAVYGSTSPGFTPPLGEQVRVVSLAVDCGPCFQRECPQGHLKCLNELPPERVLAALDELLAGDVRQPLCVS